LTTHLQAIHAGNSTASTSQTALLEMGWVPENALISPIYDIYVYFNNDNDDKI
jgi:hypothetical protein